MKSQKFKRVIVVLLVTAMAVALPSSLAKYADSKNYTMTLTKHLSWFWNSTTATCSSTNKKDHVIPLPYKGSYAIIVKGGDGSTNNGDKDCLRDALCAAAWEEDKDKVRQDNGSFNNDILDAFEYSWEYYMYRLTEFIE